MALSACDSKEKTSKFNLTQTVSMEPSWSNWYTDLKSLKEDADIVAVGTILKANPSVLEDNIPMTSFVFGISDLILDQKKLVQNSQTIIIKQTGGLLTNTLYEMQGDPLFKQGERFLLFLRFNENHTQTYVIGGPSGRFTLENGKVLTPKDGVTIDSNTSEAQFVANIKTLPLEPKNSPSATRGIAVPIINPGQSVNLFQFYGLGKAESIIVKAGANQNKIVTDKASIAIIANSLDRVVPAQQKPITGTFSQTTSSVFVVFSLPNGKAVGFEYNRTSAILISNSPESITVSAPTNFAQILGLS